MKRFPWRRAGVPACCHSLCWLQWVIRPVWDFWEIFPVRIWKWLPLYFLSILLVYCWASCVDTLSFLPLPAHPTVFLLVLFALLSEMFLSFYLLIFCVAFCILTVFQFFLIVPPSPCLTSLFLIFTVSFLISPVLFSLVYWIEWIVFLLHSLSIFICCILGCSHTGCFFSKCLIIHSHLIVLLKKLIRTTESTDWTYS